MQALDKEDPKLRLPCSEISLKELKTSRVQNLIDDMLDYVYGRNNKGGTHDNNKPMTVGLSANQVGILYQISVVDMAIGNKKINDIHVLINPKIIWHSKKKILHREGCVNLPEIWGLVPRFDKVIVECLDRSGNKLTIEAKGWTAVLLQHEIDHLHGHLFIDHLEDPRKAHFVKLDKMDQYRKEYTSWDQFIDVRKLIPKKD